MRSLRNFIIMPILLLILALAFSGACRSAETTETAGQTNEEKSTEKPVEASGAGTERAANTDAGCLVGDCENGQGTYVWPGGSKYVGQFKDGLRSSTGAYTWPSGSQYVGEYLTGLRHGKGAYTWADGHNYVGEFQSDKKQGQGVYTWPDGTVFEGVWENDERGEGKFSKLPE